MKTDEQLQSTQDIADWNRAAAQYSGESQENAPTERGLMVLSNCLQ